MLSVIQVYQVEKVLYMQCLNQFHLILFSLGKIRKFDFYIIVICEFVIDFFQILISSIKLISLTMFFSDNYFSIYCFCTAFVDLLHLFLHFNTVSVTTF